MTAREQVKAELDKEKTVLATMTHVDAGRVTGYAYVPIWKLPDQFGFPDADEHSPEWLIEVSYVEPNGRSYAIRRLFSPVPEAPNFPLDGDGISA